ncbi:hypothetical protein H5410_028074 [Solanum commersonii]|uniref:Uncharacterized protein n=1 Tax=Solanum commersonii TaxID=4109 RepID=A0A9J5Z6E9_SOLCO|nr:hypothetical protein H5410_028074 [Solanum commersonii]
MLSPSSFAEIVSLILAKLDENSPSTITDVSKWHFSIRSFDKRPQNELSMIKLSLSHSHITTVIAAKKFKKVIADLVQNMHKENNAPFYGTA